MRFVCRVVLQIENGIIHDVICIFCMFVYVIVNISQEDVEKANENNNKSNIDIRVLNSAINNKVNTH